MTNDTSEPGRGGFPAGARHTAVPSLFFSDILPATTDPAELVVSLYAFYLLGRKRPDARCFVVSELLTEVPLMQALDRLEGGAEAALRRGLSAAIGRGTLLRAVSSREGRTTDVYAAHTPTGLDLLTRLAGRPDLTPLVDQPAAAAPVLPNIFALYEENIGVISPLLADALRDAERDYPWPWIEAAFREAVALNRRNWRYIERILQRWHTEGPDVEAIRRSAEGSSRSLAGRYWRLVRR